MASLILKAIAVAAVVLGPACSARAGEQGNPLARLDDAALHAYATQPWDKASLMGTTVPLGRYQGVPVVAEFPCADVCPKYTVRIIHYVLPEGMSCATAGGVEESVPVPVAITVMQKTFCFPKPLVDARQHFTR
jgi:hypothetical protein